MMSATTMRPSGSMIASSGLLSRFGAEPGAYCFPYWNVTLCEQDVDHPDHLGVLLGGDQVLPVGGEEDVVGDRERRRVLRGGVLPQDPALGVHDQQAVVQLVRDHEGAGEHRRVRTGRKVPLPVLRLLLPGHRRSGRDGRSARGRGRRRRRRGGCRRRGGLRRCGGGGRALRRAGGEQQGYHRAPCHDDPGLQTATPCHTPSRCRPAERCRTAEAGRAQSSGHPQHPGSELPALSTRTGFRRSPSWPIPRGRDCGRLHVCIRSVTP